MTLKEIKKKVLQLIEEIDDKHAKLTSDPDIAAKLNSVINQVQFELARMKKIPANTTEEVTADEVFDLNTLDNFYQLRLLRCKNTYGEDSLFETVDNFVVFSENGTATIFYYKYPELITDTTKDNYEFELSQDCLEILPYGVAADLLKNDVSTNYGKIYAERYETMLQRLDSRYAMGSISIEGGVDI